MAKSKREWTDFYCEKCDNSWGISISPETGVYEVIERVRKSHALQSPECHAKYLSAYVRICVPNGCSPQVERSRAK
jgi:hypothetical protein